MPADKHKTFLQIDSISFGVHSQACPKYPKQQVYNIFAISQGKQKDEVDFRLLIIVKGFKVILSFKMCVARRAQIAQNKKFAISQQYIKKEVNDEVDFLLAEKHENLLQIDTVILMEMIKHFQTFQNSKFAMSLQYVKKEVRDEFDFLHADKHQGGLQVDFNTLRANFSNKVILSLLMSMMKHSQNTQSKNFANLCNISEKKLGMQFIFFTCR